MEEIKIDEEKLLRMLKRIFDLERNNAKTHEKSDKSMKDAIESIIEEEVRKCY